nr:hypothetical protein [Tanacetum cinerariifolium]
MTDYSLWEVILNGDSHVLIRVIKGVVQPIAPTTVEQRLARKNELKARGTLLMALPDKHQLKFNIHKDAKTLMEAIEKRFGGNKETKKYENFTGSSYESLDQIHDRLQKLVSQLEIHGVSISLKDVNLKFLHSLPFEWKTHTLIWRNKADLEEHSLDDLFNSLKIYKAKVKHSSSTGTTIQNLAFVSSSNTDSTTDSVSAAASVFIVCAKMPSLDNKDLKQIDVDDLEKMDLKWQMAMLTMRARRFLQKTGRNLGANGPTSMGFDMSKVECYNCHRKGHFARKCRSPKDSRRNGVAEPHRRTVPVETSTSNALVSQCAGVGVMIRVIKQRKSLPTLLLWLFQLRALLLILRFFHVQCLIVMIIFLQRVIVKVGPLVLFMIGSNPVLSLSKHAQDSSHTNRPTAHIIEDWFSDSEDESETKSPQIVPSFVQSSEQVKTPRHSVQPVETSIPAATPKPTSLKSNSSGKRRNRKTCFVCKSVDHLIKDCDYHAKKMAQPTPRYYAHRGNNKQNALLTHTNPPKHMVPAAVLTQSKPLSITAVRPVRNMSYLSDFEELNGGYVAFGGSPKGGKISGKGKIKTSKLDFEDVYFVKELKFNLFSVSQMCDKKNSVLFTETECLFLSSDFKLPDESQVLFRVHRKNNMYNVNLKSIVLSRDLTCLFAKAKIDKSNLWYRRMGHINFKTINKLVKGNLVRGLPIKVFKNDNTCVACKKGKQHRASCKTNHVSSVDQPLFRLHMDLFGLTFVKSLNNKSYSLVVTDDYSRFIWVFFLATKDETSPILKTFITGLENQLSLKVKVIKSDNRTEFKNSDLNQFYGMKGIKREFNAEAVNTACYVQYRVLVTKPHNKTPYELLHGRTPSIGFMRPFGCLVTILNILNSLGNFEGKVDEGFLVGYSVNSKAFRVFNSRTRIVQKTLHVNILENKPNIASSGPTWLFDIDSLTRTMNYQPNYDGDAAFDGKEHDFDAKKPESEVILSPSSSAQSMKQDDKTKKEAKGKSPVESFTGYRDLSVEFEDCSENSSNEVNAAVARIEAVRLFLAYASFMGFMVYQMDVKSAFLYGTIEEEVYVCQPPGFEDLDHPDKVYKVVKALYGLHQGPRAWYETLANYLLENGFQRGKIDQTLFIKKQKEDILLVQLYVDDVIFDATSKDLSMIGSLIYLTSSKPDIMFAVVLSGMESLRRMTHVINIVNNVTRLQALVDKKKVVVTKAAIREVLRLDDAEGVDCLPNEEIFTELARMGYEKPSTKLTFYKAFFSSQWKFLIHTILLSMRDADEHVEDVTAGDDAQGDDNAAHGERVDTSNDIVMDDESNQGRMIDEMDKDDAVVLMDEKEEDKKVKEAKVDENAQEDETAEVQEVVDVVTTAKLITKTVIAAIAAAPSRRRKGVVIRDPEEELNTSSIISTETKSKDKGKGIMLKAKEDLAMRIHSFRSLVKCPISSAHILLTSEFLEDFGGVTPAVQRYQVIERKPQTEAQDRKNMMMYLKNVAGFRLDYFKGMSYDDIRPIFEAKFNSNIEFLLKTKKKMKEEEEENKELQSINKTPAQKAAKRRKLNEAVEDLKRHLEIVPNEDDDVYTEATPLARKRPNGMRL